MLARRLGDQATLAAVLFDRHMAIWGAKGAESAAERTAGELRQLHHHWQLPLARAGRALLAGRFAEAEEQAAQGLAIGRRAGGQAMEVYHPGVIGCLRFMQGRYEETADLFPELAARYPAMPIFRAAAA